MTSAPLETAMTIDLEPCPFCGGQAREPIDYAGKTGCSVIECAGRDVVMIPADWNNRAPSAAARERTRETEYLHRMEQRA